MVVGLWVLSAVISLVFSGFRWFSSFDDFINRTIYGFTIGFCYGIGNWVIGTLTGRKLDWKNKLVRSNTISLLLFIVYGIIISITLPYIFAKYFWDVDPESFSYVVMLNAFISLTIDLVIITFYYSQYLVYYWKKVNDRYEALKRENISAKYNALKNQVNPHFLFNSLNTLTGVVEKDQQKAVTYIKKLSDIYRYVLEHQSQELVVLQKELDFLEDYLFLSKIRHGAGLGYKIDVQSVEKYIVPLGLQILVENSIKHNIITDDQPLEINIYEESDYLIVKNNLQKKHSMRAKEPQGISNLKNRYTFLIDKPVDIVVDESSFLVKIPILEKP
ncbi:MAG: sensor histidine kinase [Cyclobacteriaceae bacterium]